MHTFWSFFWVILPNDDKPLLDLLQRSRVQPEDYAIVVLGTTPFTCSVSRGSSPMFVDVDIAVEDVAWLHR